MKATGDYIQNHFKFKKMLFPALIVGGVLLFSLLVGAAIALGLLKILIVLFGGIFGIALLMLESKLLFKIFIVTLFFVIGQLMYFGGINQALWVPYGIGLLLYVKAYEAVMLEQIKSKDDTHTPLVLSVILFILLVVFSAVINQINLLQVFVGGKNLLFIWSVFFITAYGLYSITFIDGLWRKYYLLILFQIPLIAYQFLYVAPLRESKGMAGASWDAVVGGFGGDPMSGGASGTMAFFLVLGFVYFLALHQQKTISLRKLMLFTLLIFSMLIMAEVKVIVLLIPVALFVLYFKQLLRNPFKLFLSILALFVLFYAVLAAYEYQKRGDLESALDPEHLVETSFGYSFDSELIKEGSREMGRATAITHWWQENGTSNLLHIFFGYGPGESRSQSSFSIGSIAAKYPFNIDRSAMTQLLWEVGIVGTLLIFWLLIKASILSYSASFSSVFSSSEKASLRATSASLAMAVVMLPYGRDVLEVPILSFYLVFAIGYSVYAFKVSAARKKLK